jgi:hypothetical protein
MEAVNINFDKIVLELCDKLKLESLKKDLNLNSPKTKLYLKHKKIKNIYNGRLKRNIKLIELDSFMKSYNIVGLKGSRMSLDKKNTETHSIESMEEATDQINNTICVINKLGDPFNVKYSSIESGLDYLTERKSIFIKREPTKNKNKIQSNFLFYLINDNIIFEMERTTIWLDSNVAYLA